MRAIASTLVCAMMVYAVKKNVNSFARRQHLFEIATTLI